jgi:hypothetical protein
MNTRSAATVLNVSNRRVSLQSLLGWTVVTAGTVLIAADWLRALS